MASRQQQQQRRVVENHVSRPVRIEASSRYREEESLNTHYSIIGLRTWGQNYYETVVKNTLASSSKTETTVRATPSPQKKPVDLRLSIPYDVYSDREVHDSTGTDPADLCTTPPGAGIQNTDGQSLPSTVSKHLNGMFDEIMKEVFREDTHDGTSHEEEVFRIAACPSPTRGAQSSSQPKIEDRRKENVVLNMQDMSPLLNRMREIDRARNGNIALPLSSKPSSVTDEAVDLEMQQDVTSARKNVPSLVNFYDSYDGQNKRPQKAPGRGKPPLPAPQGVVKYLESLVGPQYSKKVEQMMHVNVLPLVQKNVLPLMHRITHGKRMVFAMIAMAYIVAIHVYIITSKL